jgi:hypothetical protein
MLLKLIYGATSALGRASENVGDMVVLAIPLVLVCVYGAAAALHAALLIPGGAIKAHVNLLAACGNATVFLAAVALFVSSTSSLATGWFWLFVTGGSAIHYLVLSFYLYTDRTARMGGFVCDVFANTAVLLVVANVTIAENAWVQAMVVLWAVVLKALSAIISLLYRYRAGWRPAIIIAIGFVAKTVVVVGVLLSPSVLFVGPSPIWDSLICGGLIFDHVIVGILCMWYTEANDSVKSLPVLARFMGVGAEIAHSEEVRAQVLYDPYGPGSVVVGGRVLQTAGMGYGKY